MKDLHVRLAGPIQTDSIVNGEGLRTVIWFQGCPHHCFGCHNPGSHSTNKGTKVLVSKIKEQLYNLKDQDGITFSGGEPMSQPEALLEIAKEAKSLKLNVWCYTGFTFEALIEMSKTKEIYEEILTYIDVLIDGPFIESEKTLNTKFRGSRNQRIIASKKSLKKGSPIEIQKYKKERKL